MAMATSSSFLSIPLPKTSSLLSPVKHCASPLSSEFRALSLYGGRNGVSTSLAMATEAQISTQDDKMKDEENKNIWKNGCTAVDKLRKFSSCFWECEKIHGFLYLLEGSNVSGANTLGVDPAPSPVNDTQSLLAGIIGEKR
ncbi:hypothetical protein DVH24_011098 [Malus domestica]|uniref:Uncharacterized protein n=1 Tax=Malus domestica TaxID=3750 RepID=A0A498JXT0_MALDO|nr:hypothetical protein DVH24_011098 [Malus domestica]